MNSVLESFIRLPLAAIPDVFERALGYSGFARFLLLSGEPSRAEVI